MNKSFSDRTKAELAMGMLISLRSKLDPEAFAGLREFAFMKNLRPIGHYAHLIRDVISRQDPRTLVPVVGIHVVTPTGNNVVLEEPADVFPSETLLTQLALIEG